MFGILIIENDLKVRELLRLFLQHERFSVLCTSNCDDAYKILEDHKEFQILFLLLSYPNRILSRQQIMNEIKEA